MASELEYASAAACATMDETSSPETSPQHRPVLVQETLNFLQPRPGAVIVDATVGLGGHSLAILPHLIPHGRLIALDRDERALELARKRLVEFDELVTFIHDDFRNLPLVLENLGIRQIDGVIADLGMSSMQVDSAERGFSFAKSGPLDMRMDQSQPLSAGSLVNTWSAEELQDIIGRLGEERFAGRIARRIAQARDKSEIRTTAELAEIIRLAVPPQARYGRIHPATRTFQALRMAVNDEVGALEQFLGSLHGLLRAGGRAVLISFHSLEDRPVKQTFAEGKRHGIWTVLTKKPCYASEQEISENPRARSAKLRAVERGPNASEGPFS